MDKKAYATGFKCMPRDLKIVLGQNYLIDLASIEHDKNYFNQQMTRLEADKVYFEKILFCTNDIELARVYYKYVRLFGWLSWWPRRIQRFFYESII